MPWSPTSQEMDERGYGLNPGALFPALVREKMEGRQMVPNWEKQRVPFTHLCPVPTAGCWELVNTWCNLVTLTAHLRQKGQVPPDGEGAWRGAGEEGPRVPRQRYQRCLAFLPALPATIALLAEDGHLVSLDEGASEAPSMGSSLLQERGTYVLVQIISKWGPRFPFGVMLGCVRGTAVQRPPKVQASPQHWPGPSLDPSHRMPCWDAQTGPANKSRVRGGGGNHQASQELVFLPPQRERMGPPPAMSPYWRTWMTGIQSLQVSLTVEPQGEGAPSPQPP